MWRQALGTTAAALALAAAAGCTGDSTVQAVQDDRADDEVVLTDDVAIGVVPASAVIGEELFIADQHSGDGTRVVKVSTRGDIAELAEAPALQSRALIGAGGALVLLGVHCPDEECAAASLVGYVYSPEHKTWRELDVPQFEVYAETLVAAVGGTADRAVVDVGAGLVTVDADANVTDITAAGHSVASLGCATARSGDIYDVPIQPEGDEPMELTQSPVVEGAPVYRIPEVLHAGRDASPDRWQRLEAPPMPQRPRVMSILCDADALVLIGDGVEYRYSDAGWQVNADDKVLAERFRDRPIQSQSATTEAEVLVSVGVDATTPIVRTPRGEWATLDEPASSVLGAVGSGVFLGDRLENSVRFIDMGTFER